MKNYDWLKNAERFWCISEFGNIEHHLLNSSLYNKKCIKKLIKISNIFRTREDARAAKKRVVKALQFYK